MEMKGKTILHYRIDKVIGEGSFGKVYLATDLSNQQQVAVKYLTTTQKNKRQIQNMRSETDILKKIKHENVIMLRDMVEIEGYIVVVMDYAGSDLDKLLKKEKKLSLERVKMYGQQILSAMLYLHENRILHRDLKPQNILLKGNTIKICDFGFAKKMSASINFLESIKGTPLYIAPEIMNSKPYTHKVDVWSFGIILYELFVGGPPFYASNIPSLRPKILFDNVKFPPDMPASLRELIDGMLQKCPTKRYDWLQVQNHQFFKTTVPSAINLAQTAQNLDLRIQNANAEPIARLDPEEQCRQIARIDSQLINHKLDPIQLKTNSQFYHRVIAIIGQACLDRIKIPNQTLKKIFTILIKLILKTKLPSEKKDSDITKNPQLITAVITLAEQENDQDMLQSELQLIGYMLKNNFDGIKIDWENAEELLDFIPKLFAKKQTQGLSHSCFVICLMILGILASQAYATIQQSQQFFINVSQDKLLTLICSTFQPNSSHTIVLQCLQQFIHPNPNADLHQSLSIKMRHLIQSMKKQVAIALLSKQLISQQSPLQLYCTEQSRVHIITTYFRVLFECLTVSHQMRIQYAAHNYWIELVCHPKCKLHVLACNNLLLNHQHINTLPKQKINEIIQKPKTDQSKLINVYLLNIANFNLSKKSQQKTKIDYVKVILANIRKLLTIQQDVKTKAAKDILAATQQHSKYFDQLLIDIFHQIVIDGGYKEQLSSICKQLSQRCLLQLKLSELSLLQLLTIFEIYPSIVKQVPTKIQTYFYEMLTADKWQYLSSLHGVDKIKKLIQKLLANSISKAVLNPKQQNDMLKQLMQTIEQTHFNRLMFSDQFLTQQTLKIGLQLMNTFSSKCRTATFDYLAVQVLPYRKQLFKTTDLQLLQQLIVFTSFLAGCKQPYSAQLRNWCIVQHCARYLTMGQQAIEERVVHLIGNLARYGKEHFDQLAKYKIVPAINKCLNEHSTNARLMKNAIYALGNISFYNQQFAEDIKPMVKFYANGLTSNDGYYVSNTISAVSNLLRHSSFFVKELIATGVSRLLIEVALKSDGGQQLTLSLNALKKGVVFPQFIRQHRGQLKEIYDKKRTLVDDNNESIKALKRILSN